MNGRKAKSLRRAAESMTIGFSRREYLGKAGYPRTLWPRCTRAVYQRLKCAYKRARGALRDCASFKVAQ